ncbi:MAG TPA: ankyrin repeat domain-containing protein [Vicinamibacterales bacterium]|nr:ankyrin repeat domain-containing protein [Vicinamibacterales bacterium]
MSRHVIGGLGLSVLGALSLSALLLAAPGTFQVADAAMRRDSAAVRTLLEQGADVSTAQGDGMTALHWASVNGDVPLAQMLIYAGADLEASTRIDGYTPLDLAARNGHAAVVDALLTSGASAKAATIDGTTPLMLAAEAGNEDAVTALIAHGADVNATESAKGETALMFAAAYGRTGVVRILLAHGADWKPTTHVFDWMKLAKGDPRLPHFNFGRRGNAAAAKNNGAGATATAGKGGPVKGEKVDGAKGAPTGKPAASPDENFLLGYARLVGRQGGLTALLFAVRQGYRDSVEALLQAGADVNQVDAADHTSPLLIAVMNGHFDLAEMLLARGANPNLAQDNGVTPLYAVLNCVWAPRTLYPQPTSYKQQKTDYLTLMKDLLDHGAQPNPRLTRKVWYSAYNFDQSGLDETGATPFWRAAYADDVAAMTLLVARGADPALATMKPKGRPPTGTGDLDPKGRDLSGLRPIPVGGPDVTPLLAASGEGYGWSFTANHHQYAPAGMLPAVRYLVEQLHVDVNSTDAEGNTALHNAAARGDNAMILYLVSRGANVKAVNRKGQTVADMANGPVQRTSPFPDTIALLQKMGAPLMHKCLSCG